MGIRDKTIAARSPWQNSFTERLIGTICRECVDHIVVLGETHLRRILREYAQYGENAPVIGPGCAGLSPGPANRTHRVTRPGWRAASPIRPDLSFRHAQGRWSAYFRCTPRKRHHARPYRIHGLVVYLELRSCRRDVPKSCFLLVAALMLSAGI